MATWVLGRTWLRSVSTWPRPRSVPPQSGLTALVRLQKPLSPPPREPLGQHLVQNNSRQRPCGRAPGRAEGQRGPGPLRTRSSRPRGGLRVDFLRTRQHPSSVHPGQRSRPHSAVSFLLIECVCVGGGGAHRFQVCPSVIQHLIASVCSPPKSPSITIHPPLPSSTSPPLPSAVTYCLCLSVFALFLCLISSPSHPGPPPAPHDKPRLWEPGFLGSCEPAPLMTRN